MLQPFTFASESGVDFYAGQRVQAKFNGYLSESKNPVSGGVATPYPGGGSNSIRYIAGANFSREK